MRLSHRRNLEFSNPRHLANPSLRPHTDTCSTTLITQRGFSMSHAESYLVACSDPCDRDALLAALSAPGVTVQQAATIMEAEKILSAATAVVFCEDRLPGGGYLELLRIIRQAQFQIPLV